MEHGLFGVDIQPIAVHLTVMRLSSFAMDQSYKRANIIYAGLDGSGSTGALELLKQKRLLDLFAGDEDDEEKLHAPAPDNRFGLCIMNPPYSRTRRGQSVFRVSQLSANEKEASQKRHRTLIKDTFANAQAGMASSFAALANKKLWKDGVYASVLPATMANSATWTDFRRYLWKHYRGVTVVSMAGDKHQSFSAGTGMGEALVVATKGRPSTSPLHFISLYAFPRHTVEAEVFVHTIRAAMKRAVPSEPIMLRVGKALIGYLISCELAEDESWAAVGVRDLSLIGLMNKFHRYANMQPMEDVFEVGPTHHLIGHLMKGDPIDAFRFGSVYPGVTPVHPSLWAKNHQTQRTILTLPTHDGEPVPGRDDLQKQMRAQRTQFFWGRDLRMTSQALNVAYTEKLCLGGTAWAGLRANQEGMDKALCLWANSIFGLVWGWLYGAREQSGRSRRQIDAIRALRIPRFDERALAVAAENFEELIRLPLKPCAYAQWDENRQRIDAAVYEMFGFGEMFHSSEMFDFARKNPQENAEDVNELRLRWCQEPGVHGGKKEIIELLKKDGLLA